MFNPDNQYRCTIIRGKSQNKMDDLLPLYANIIDEICPCEKKNFDHQFNDKLSLNFFKKTFDKLSLAHQKTIRNHATEVAGKLFCLYLELDNCIQISDSCRMLLEYKDQPAFFKNLCLNFQFPNASQKSSTIIERIQNNIKFKPFHFIVQLLHYTQENGESLTKQDIAYYALNSLEVLQGRVTVKEVYDTIIKDRADKITKHVLEGSKEMQHITEQLNLLELANLIRPEKGTIKLNDNEKSIIQIFKSDYDKDFFDIWQYYDKVKANPLDHQVYNDWAKYYSMVRYDYTVVLQTNAKTFPSVPEVQPEPNKKLTTVEIGNKGENYIYQMEVERVRQYKSRLVNKVLLLGHVKGLGYDISSLEAEGKTPEFTRYIEVKTTIRVTEPTFNDSWRDSLSLTAKEWSAAQQHAKFYNIYRVFFTPTKIIVYRINNPYSKSEEDELDVYPTMYQMEVKNHNIEILPNA